MSEAAKSRPARARREESRAIGPTLELEDSLGFRLRVAQTAVQRDFIDCFGRYDITPSLYSILMLIERHPGSRQIEIGAALGIHQTNLVERIDTLVGRGFVSRAPDPLDRRANTLRLTPEGAAFVARMHAVHDGLTGRLEERLGRKNLAKLIELLKMVGA